MRIFLRFILAIEILVGLSCPTSAKQATVALLNGTIATMDGANPTGSAIAWTNDKIMAVGSDEDISKLVGPDTKTFDLKKRFVMPGFIESHGHYSSMGFAKMQLDLTDDVSWEDIVAKVAEAARTTPKGEWISGRGWHQEKWTMPLEQHVEGYPLHDALSKVSPNHPVVLDHASGHMVIANARAMELAGIDVNTEDPEGGEILRDENGDATGVLRETAGELVTKVRDRLTDDSLESWRRAIELAGAECLANGVTSFHDAGSSLDEIERFKGAALDGALPVRLWVMVLDEPHLMQAKLKDAKLVGFENGYLTVRAIKQSMDGALGAHGAWLSEPYDDLPSSTGMNTIPLEQLAEVAKLAVKHDFQLCVHGIGDRANHEVLNVFERTFSASPDRSDWRWRIEHAQHLLPNDIPRFADLGVVASMQGIHCTSDAVFVLQRLGQRRAAQGAYMWRSLLDAGATICNGTDVPVEGISPIESFYASVTRKTSSGVAFFPEQSMTRIEALRSYTAGGAFAAFEEDIKGTLSPGKLADVVVLSNNLLTCPEESIRATTVDMTFVGGELRYER